MGFDALPNGRTGPLHQRFIGASLRLGSKAGLPVALDGEFTVLPAGDVSGRKRVQPLHQGLQLGDAAKHQVVLQRHPIELRGTARLRRSARTSEENSRRSAPDR